MLEKLRKDRKQMLTDYHCHILPGIDDGAKDTEMSLGMLEKMKEQGVSRVIATPHFYAHRERDIKTYLEKRSAAFRKIGDRIGKIDLRLGAEIAIERGISGLDGIEKLAAEGTDLILLELPYRQYENFMSEEIYNISAEYGLTVVIAHIHRYLKYYSKDEMKTILDSKAIFQVNCEAFASFRERRFVRKLIKEGFPLIFGSDCHDLDKRRPNWDILKKKVPGEIISAADSVLDEHLLV